MKSPFECPRYAKKCRDLANGKGEDRRREILRMADIWEGPAARDPEQVHPSERSGSGLDTRTAWATAIRAQFEEMTRKPLPNRLRDLLERLDNVA